VTGADQRPTPHEKKTGARNRKITHCARRKNGEEQNSFQRKRLCLLTCLLMGDTRLSSFSTAAEAATAQESETKCEKGGAKLVLRVARRGKNPGNKFWGCSNYPKCTFTKTYTG
jgi:hypothetical protein